MTPIQKHLKNHRKELTLDTFGEIIDEFITKNECQMLITFPEGSSEPTVRDNMGIGPVGALYFLLKALTPTMNDMFRIFARRGAEFDREKLVTQILAMVKDELMEE